MSSNLMRTIGNDIKVSAMGFGCWPIGGNFYFYGKYDGYGNVDDDESIRALRRALDLGVNFFDTSDCYGIGHSEELIGKAFNGMRKEVVIATKFGYTFNEKEKDIIGEDVSREGIRRSLEASLKRLQTDYIDLYQLHVWSIGHEKIQTVIDTMEELKKEGAIRAYGWSSGDVACQKIFIKHSTASSIQHPMNILSYDKEILQLCETHGLASITNMPLAMGFLSGKYDATSTFSSNDVRGSGHDWVTYFEDGRPKPDFLEKLENIKEILRSNGRSLVQGALAWLWAKSETNIPIPGFKSIAQVEENARALAFGPLSEKNMKDIEEILSA